MTPGNYSMTVRGMLQPMMTTRAILRHDDQGARPESNLRRLAGRMRLSLVGIAYLVAITLAELITALADPIWGIVFHGLILGGLIIHSALTGSDPDRRFLRSLTVAPVIRIISLGMPLGVFPQEWWYALTSIPLFAIAFLLIRSLPLGWQPIGLRFPAWRDWPLTILVMSSGVLLGFAEYTILQPRPLVGSLTLESVALPAAVLMVSTGLIEELLFRGILQATATESFGTWRGIAYVSLLFGVLHIGHLSIVDVGFVIGVALYFAVIVHWTRTLIGVSLAHGITNIMLFIVIPLLLT